MEVIINGHKYIREIDLAFPKNEISWDELRAWQKLARKAISYFNRYVHDGHAKTGLNQAIKKVNNKYPRKIIAKHKLIQ